LSFFIGKIFFLEFSIIFIISQFNLKFASCVKDINSLEKSEQTLSESSTWEAIFRNIKNDFSLSHHFHFIIEAIIFAHSTLSSLA